MYVRRDIGTRATQHVLNDVGSVKALVVLFRIQLHRASYVCEKENEEIGSRNLGVVVFGICTKFGFGTYVFFGSLLLPDAFSTPRPCPVLIRLEPLSSANRTSFKVPALIFSNSK